MKTEIKNMVGRALVVAIEQGCVDTIFSCTVDTFGKNDSFCERSDATRYET